MSEELTCYQCGLVTDAPTVEQVALPGGGFHLKASCPDCGKYIKFLPQDGPKIMHFGKHKDRPLSEIREKDPEYLRWLIKQDWCKPKLRRDVEQELGL